MAVRKEQVRRLITAVDEAAAARTRGDKAAARRWDDAWERAYANASQEERDAYHAPGDWSEYES